MTDRHIEQTLAYWRYRVGVWLLKPHWLPLLMQKNEAIRTAGSGPDEATRRGNLTYEVIGIKLAIGVGKKWSRY